MELISVKEYAKRNNISTQAVYKKLDNELKPFLEIKGKRKYIRVEEQEEKQEPETQENKRDKAIELLEEQLKNKDKQIEELQQLLHQQQFLTLQANNKIELLELKVKQVEQVEPEPKQEAKKRTLWDILTGKK